jgi:hypothetical protein
MSAPRRSARIAAKAAAAPVTPVKAPKPVVVPSAPIKPAVVSKLPVLMMEQLVERYEPLASLQESVSWFEKTSHYTLMTSLESRKEARERISKVADDADIIRLLLRSFDEEIATRKNIMEVVYHEESEPTVSRFHQIMKQQEEYRISELSQLYDYCEDLAARFLYDMLCGVGEILNTPRYNVLGDSCPETVQHITQIETVFNSMNIPDYRYGDYY